MRTLLVANRGEIARRIFRSAMAKGLRCAAVFVNADADAPFVTEADVAVRIDDYLSSEEILRAARECSADALHPGYGFLSENAGFASAVIDAGLVWVGPEPSVIESMGDKIRAKEIAEQASIPLLASTTDPDQAASLGYPLLVKAAAGGGGKGMRVVESPDDLVEGLASAQREALSGFGDDRVFIERYVANARHIEVQVLGDVHGNVVHLGERECSIQRRHQKIIEESPSAALDATTRNRICGAAVELANAIGYTSAGTVEFLYDDDLGDFFFLEVNTRLQVEHPVTEVVTGIDLVAEQLRLAGGEPLGYSQDDVTFEGHAIEARLYAEDPSQDFLPATGTLATFSPATEPEVRWDSGVETGSVVGTSFDPMLAKVISHAPTREDAANKLALALERLHLGGVTTNRDFLASALRSETFLSGNTTTNFISALLSEQPADNPETSGLSSSGCSEQLRAARMAAMWLCESNGRANSVWAAIPTNWRNARLPKTSVTLAPCGGDPISVSYSVDRSGQFCFGDETTATVHAWSESHIDAEIDGVRSKSSVTRTTDAIHVQTTVTTVSFDVVPQFAPPDSAIPAGGLIAPMPGLVLDVRVNAGDTVTAGQLLVVLEAMKMEHHITAPFDGTVNDVSVTVSDQVETGTLLVTIDGGHDDNG